MQVSKKMLALAGVAVVSLAAAPAFAHHSFAMFDNAKNTTLEGTIKEFQWTNPHSWIQVEVPHDGGGTDEWSVEMGSPFELLRVGWKPTTVKAGDKVTIQIHPTKDGSKGGGFVSGVDAGGHELGGGK